MARTCKDEWGDRYPVAATWIGRVWFFDDLPAPERAALVAAASRKLYPKGARVFREGEPATQMFLIKAGRVKLSKLTAAGSELTLDYGKGGDFLGETGLHIEAAYPLAATCTEDTITCGFTKAGFEALVLRHPNIGLQVIRNLSRRMGVLAERAQGVAGPSDHRAGTRQGGLRCLPAHESAGAPPRRGPHRLPWPLPRLRALSGRRPMRARHSLGRLAIGEGTRAHSPRPLPRRREQEEPAMPVPIPTHVQEFMQGKPGWVATASRDGMPNVAVKGSLQLLDAEHLLFADLFSLKTRKNLEENPQVAVMVADNAERKGYILKGRAELIAHGPLYDQTAAALKAKLPHLPPPKYVVRITVEAVFDQSLGPSAGQQIA